MPGTERQPEPSPTDAAREVGKEDARAQAAEAQAKFESQEVVERFLFDLNTSDGSFLAGAWERLQANEGFKKEKEWILGLMRDIAKRLVEAFKKRSELIAETEFRLEELDFGRHVAVLGHALKSRDTTYGAAGEGPLTLEDVMALKRHIEQMAALNMEELVNMIFEDEKFIIMLAEQRKMPGEAPPKQNMLSPRNLKYEENMDSLYDFITGPPEAGRQQAAGSREKDARSEFRKMAEAMIWQDIVRTLGKRQKRDLIVRFLEKSSVEDTNKFIAGCVITGAMNRAELLEIYEKETKPDAMYADLFAKLGTKEVFDKLLTDSVKAKAVLADYVKQQAQQIAAPQIRSAASFYLSADKIVVETIGRCAALSAAISTIMLISDRWQAGGGGWKGLLTAIPLGVKDAITTPHVIGGVAIAAMSADYIHPWMKEWAHAPSGDERELLDRTREERLLANEAKDNPEFVNRFVKNYDDYVQFAKDRENQDWKQPGTEKLEARRADIYPGDLTGAEAPAKLKITPQRAGELGCQTAQEAEAKIIRLFGICTRVLKPPVMDQEELIKYLEDKKLANPLVMAGIKRRPRGSRQKKKA